MKLPSHVCHIQPEHVSLLATFGTVIATMAIISLLSRKTYATRVISREEEPLAYWLTVASYGLLALFVLGGSLLCPLR